MVYTSKLVMRKEEKNISAMLKVDMGTKKRDRQTDGDGKAKLRCK